MHMKRTNLVLDADLLDRTTRVLGVKTYSAAVILPWRKLFVSRKLRAFRSTLVSANGKEISPRCERIALRNAVAKNRPAVAMNIGVDHVRSDFNAQFADDKDAEAVADEGERNDREREHPSAGR